MINEWDISFCFNYLLVKCRLAKIQDEGDEESEDSVQPLAFKAVARMMKENKKDKMLNGQSKGNVR